ncbi:MAG: ATP-binding protein [Candidatus Thorarchaeota archaeon]|jgi:ferredoxin
MVKRLMIMIDEDKCTGCGLCVPSCAEGALQIVDGKAKVVSETFCDGLGACLGHCPEGALTLREVETVEFDEEAAMTHVAQMQSQAVAADATGSSVGCAGSEAFTYSAAEDHSAHDGAVPERVIPSQLQQWPVKLRLLSPQHPIFEDSSIVIVADCAGPAYAGLHEDFLKGKAAVLVCPKFEDYNANVDKLSTIFRLHNVKDITLVHMEVPCCHGLARATQDAIQNSGKDIPLRTYVIGVRGEIKAVT